MAADIPPECRTFGYVQDGACQGHAHDSEERMDPNACLNEIRRLTAKRNNDPASFDSFDAATLCELVDGLDLWMTRGGFLPEEWER